jgi:ribosomal protein S18 acetylase RimI-like enzyme
MKSPSSYKIVPARPEQLRDMLELFPRLADFEIPDRRQADDLWRGDAELLEKWAHGEIEAMVMVAVTSQEDIAGVAFARCRLEALSHRPSAHLEAIAVAKEHEGHGLGRELLAAIEKRCRDQGAETLTLNVFRVNQRARGFYERLGFDEELIRCIKTLD